MATDEEIWQVVASGREQVHALVARCKQFWEQLPKLEELVDRRDHLKRYFGHTRSERRARLVHDELTSRIQQFYDDFRTFTDEARREVEHLNALLPDVHLGELTSQLQPNAIEGTYRALRQAADQIEKLWLKRPVKEALAADREARLQHFLKQQTTQIVDVRRSAGVHKSDMQKWRKGVLPDTSIISRRIEDVLSGKTPLKRKLPRKPT